MALIGNGAQSDFQAIGFHHVLGITEIRAFDTDSAATDKLVRNLSAYPGITVVRCSSAREAARGADIITTVTADTMTAMRALADVVGSR